MALWLREWSGGSHMKSSTDAQDYLYEQDIQSLVAAPIFAGQKLWGSIGFDMCRSEREWSQVEMDALKTAAETLGAAIERKQYEDALREREVRINRQNDALLQLATVKALGSGDLDTALREITRVTSETMNVARVGIWFYADDESAIVCELLYNSSTDDYESGTVLKEQQYPAYFAALRQNRIIAGMMPILTRRL
jgi:GAF domain-containing protein